MNIGILALQGAVEPHKEKLSRLGVTPIEVRRSDALLGIEGIILPGGESSTMLKLLKLNHLWGPLKEFAGMRPTWGVCAGAILLAKDVSAPKQESLEIIDIAIERNAYGRQLESFTDTITTTEHWPDREPTEEVFIRSPRICKVGDSVTTLATHKGRPVMIEQGYIFCHNVSSGAHRFG